MLLKLLSESLFFVLYHHQDKDAAVLLLPSTQAYVGLRVGVERHVFLACIAESKTRSEQKRVIQSDQDVQVFGLYIFFFGDSWMNSFA